MRPRVPPPPKEPGPRPRPRRRTPAAPETAAEASAPVPAAAEDLAEDDPAEHRAAHAALPRPAGAAVRVLVGPYVLFGELLGLPRERVRLLGLRQRARRIRAGQGEGALQVPLRLRQPGPGLAADRAPTRGDVVRRRADGAAGRQQRLLQQARRPLPAALPLTGPREGLVEGRVGLLDPAQRVDRVVPAAACSRRTSARTDSARPIRPLRSAVEVPCAVPLSRPRASARSVSVSLSATGSFPAASASSRARRSTASTRVVAWSTALSAARTWTAALPLSPASIAARASPRLVVANSSRSLACSGLEATGAAAESA